MSTEAKKIANHLSSSNWTLRLQAQKSLDALSDAQTWKQIFEELPTDNYSVLNVACKHFCAFLVKTKGEQALDPLLFLYGEQSPIGLHESLCKMILEDLLITKGISYRQKVDLITKCLGNKPFPKDVPLIVYLLKATGFLRAKKATPYFSAYLDHSDPKVIHQIISTIHSIKDIKSAPLLQRYFDHENPRIASEAIEAYGDIGGNKTLQTLQLYRRYPDHPPRVRMSIINALCKIANRWLDRCLIRLYSQETDIEVKCYFIKKMGQQVSSRVGTFLMETSANEKEVKIRSRAAWAISGLPAERIQKCITQAIRHSNGQIQRWGILKAGELTPKLAKKLLDPILNDFKTQNPIIQQTLVEAIHKLPKTDSLNMWLLENIGVGPIVTPIIVTTLLRHNDAPALAVLDAVEKEQTQALEFALSIMYQNQTFCEKSELIERVLTYLSHENLQIRHLATRFLVRSRNREVFQSAFKFSMAEKGEDRQIMAQIIAAAMERKEVLISWIPWNDFKPEPPAFLSFLETILDKLKTAQWDLDQWRDFILAMTLIPKNGQIFWTLNTFLISQQNFLASGYNRIMVVEKEAKILALMAEFNRTLHMYLKKETVHRLFTQLSSNHYDDEESVIEIITSSKYHELLVPYVEWLLSLEDGERKQKAYHSLANWITRPEQNEEKRYG